MAEVDAVTLKLPPFWPNLPLHWFHQIESQFNTRGINTERTKYDYLISSLSQEIITTVFDVMQSIVTTNSQTPYTTLKNALISRFTKSDATKIELLLSDSDIGDRKPSEFYHSLMNLMGTSAMVSEEFILNRWMKRLPTQVQASLRTVPNTTSINDLLKIADNVYEVFEGQSQSFSVNGISSANNANMLQDLAAQNNRLENEIFEIRRMLSNLNVNTNNDSRNSRSRAFNENRQNYRSRSRSKTPANNKLCWYHEKYGSRAHKCIKPCSFSTRSSN